MVNKVISFLIVTCLVLAGIACNKTPFEETQQNVTPEQSSGTPVNFAEIKFSVPDSVSDKINDLAADEAIKLGCDGIRILQAEMKDGSIKYHVMCFKEIPDNIIFESFISSDGIIEEITPDEYGLVSGIWTEKHQALKKSNVVTECLNLAYFYADASYGGSSFLVTQLCNQETGYWHKLMYCLGTSSCLTQCSGSFSGGFNNLLSSHEWPQYEWNGGQWYVDPDLIRVYNGTNLGSLLHTFSGTCANWDSNWTDNYCNNLASSLRLQYWTCSRW